MSSGVPSQRDPSEVPFTPDKIEEGDTSLIPRYDNGEPMSIVDMVEQGLITEEDLALVGSDLDDETLAMIHRRYEVLVATLENMRAQQDMLRQQLGLLAIRNAELTATNEELEKELMTDSLTGLGSRKALDMRRDELLAQLTGERRRTPEDDIVAVVVMSVDIIDLGGTNLISQDAGDELLILVAQAMSAQFRDGDVFRRGGDEFIGLFPVRNMRDFMAIYEKMSNIANSEAGQRLRLGYFVSYAHGSQGLSEAEQLADPKVHKENRIEVRGAPVQAEDLN